MHQAVDDAAGTAGGLRQRGLGAHVAVAGNIEDFFARRCHARRLRRLGDDHDAEARLFRLERGLCAHHHARHHADRRQCVARDPLGEAQRQLRQAGYIEGLNDRLELGLLDRLFGADRLVPDDAEAVLWAERDVHEFTRRQVHAGRHDIVVGLVERDRQQDRYAPQPRMRIIGQL